MKKSTAEVLSNLMKGHVQVDQLDAHQRKDIRHALRQSNSEMAETVIAAFLLENLNAFRDWIEDLGPYERRDCLSWIMREFDKNRCAQRRLDWIVGKGLDKAMEHENDALTAECMAANEEGSRLFDNLCDFRFERRSPADK